MKKLEDIRNIVNRSKEGWSDSKIAKEYHMSRNTVRKYRKRYWEAQEQLRQNNPDVDISEIVEILNNDPKYDSSNRRPYKYSKELDDLLERILDEEVERLEKEGSNYKKTPKTQIHKRCLEEGFDLGYTTISKKIDEKRLARRNMEPWVHKQEQNKY